MNTLLLLVLSSLAESDKHGYAMMQDIEAFAGIRLDGAITRLEEHGWIGPVGPKNAPQTSTDPFPRPNRLSEK